MVDELLSVSPISSSLEGVSLLCETSSWSFKLEWPQKVVGFLEMWTNSWDFVDQILNADNTVLAQNFFDNGVSGQRNSLFFNLTITSLKDKLSNCLSGWVSESDVWFNSSQEVGWSLVDSDEWTVMQLSQSQYSQDSDWSWVKLINTPNSNNKC